MHTFIATLRQVLGQRSVLAIVALLAVLVLLVGVALMVRPAFLSLPEVPPGAQEEPIREEDPNAFTRWLTEGRGVEDSGIPVNRYVEAERALRDMLARDAELEAQGDERAQVLASIGAAARPWTWLGPSNWGGRTRAFVIDPTNPGIMLAGGITGGVWRTEDGGVSWTPLTDTFSNIAVGVLELDPANPSIVYAGTGEAYWAPHRYRGDGIMKSTDGGVSWAFLPSTVGRAAFAWVGDVEVSHNDPNRVYAATRAGVWLSVDGGASWGAEPVLPSASPVGCMELAIRTDRNPDVIFASCGVGYQASPDDGVYRSADGGLTWERVLPAGDGGQIGFAALAIAPSNQDVIYASASVADPSESAEGLYRSTQGGVPGSWELRASPRTGAPDWLANCWADYSYAQGGYDNAVAVDPTNQDRIWVGGIDLYRSHDGGATLELAADWSLDPVDGTPYVHADQHLIAFHTNYDGVSNRTVFFANDGGLFRTDDDRADLTGSSGCNVVGISYSSFNDGYGVSQFVGGALSDAGDIIVAGTQDNGSYRLDAGASPDQWSRVWGGDGGNSAVHPSGDWTIVSNYNFYFYRQSDGRQEEAANGITDYDAEENCFCVFYPPLEMDPGNPAVLWTGGLHIWSTADEGRNWVKRSGPLNDLVSALAIGPSDGNLVYVGTANGSVYRSTNALSSSPTWTDVDPNAAFPVEEVSSIAIDPRDPNTVFVGFRTFDGNQLWKTTTAAGSWYSVDASIPDVPVNAVAVNPRNSAMVYAGTDMGVFESLDGGETWRVGNENLATTIVSRLVFRRDTSELYAFTFGRGAYRVDVGDQSPPRNDEISTATDVILAPDFRDRLDIRAASSSTTDPALTCGSALLPTQTRSVWYRFQPAQSGRYAVTTAGSTFDTVLAVFIHGGAPDAPLQEIACNDDSVAALGPSSVAVELQAGITYYIEATRSASSPTDTLANTLVLTVSPP